VKGTGPWRGIDIKDNILRHYWSPQKEIPLPLLSVTMSSRRFLGVMGESWMKPIPVKTVVAELGVRKHPVAAGISKRAT
jgi:hypothetical protein